MSLDWKFLALDRQELDECTIGRKTLYRGEAKRSVGDCERGSIVYLTEKEYEEYLEFNIAEDSI